MRRANCRRALRCGTALLVCGVFHMAVFGDDGADVPAQDLRADGNEHMRYFLIGGAQPPSEEAGSGEDAGTTYKLLVVLPGGNGSAEFLPFVQRIHANALGPDWLVAELVAPVWSPDQAERIVWPTRKSRWKGMKFPTEDFIEAVIADVRSRHAIDERHVYAMGWSSGGPPCYAASLRKDTPIRGTFVAMSVFKPRQLGSLSRAQGHAYYVLHSPTDFIPLRMAEDAVTKLGKKGARVHLEQYSGGHGWHGDVYGHIREALDWLQREPHAAP